MLTTYVKLGKAQLTKIIQLGGFLGNMIGKLFKEALTRFAVPLAKDILSQLAAKATLLVIKNFEK